jgi:SAM-dependent methyltransferase
MELGTGDGMKHRRYQRFHTQLGYVDRETKAAHVYSKYGALLKGTVLDVGADAQYLKPYVEENGGEYLGVGLGPKVDLEVNLDCSPLPFPNASFDTVLCLDVLEHLERSHFVLGELCRVARGHVVISLPNPFASFFSMLRHGDYSVHQHLKHYGLPPEPPEDRHRWFFSNNEAKEFVRYNAEKANFSVLQIDNYGEEWSGMVRRLKLRLAFLLLRPLFRSDIDQLGLHSGTLWCVLERNS